MRLSITILSLLLTGYSTFAQQQRSYPFLRLATSESVNQIENGTLLSDSVFSTGIQKFSYVSGSIRSEYDELSTAQVLLVDDSTGLSAPVMTNDLGEFETRVRPGNYYFRILHHDFHPVNIPHMKLLPGEKHVLRMLIEAKDDPNATKK